MTNRQGWNQTLALAAAQHGAFGRAQANEHGLDTRRLRRAVRNGRLRQPLSDVYVLADHPRTWRHRLMILCLAGATVSHRSAAAVHEFDRFSPGKLEVTVARTNTRRLPQRVVVHRSIVDGDTTLIDGLTVSTPARTLIELAQVLPLPMVEPALDSALRAGLPMAEIEATIERLWRPGPTGLAPLRDLMADPARSGAVPDSLFERLVERLLADNAIPTPVRQFEVQLEQSRRRLDLAWPTLRVGVEAHSKLVHFGRAAVADDNDRDLELAAAGWEILYITWKTAHEPATFLRHLRAVLDRRAKSAARLGVAPVA